MQAVMASDFAITRLVQGSRTCMQSWPRTGSPRQEGMQAEMASDFAMVSPRQEGMQAVMASDFAITRLVLGRKAN